MQGPGSRVLRARATWPRGARRPVRRRRPPARPRDPGKAPSRLRVRDKAASLPRGVIPASGHDPDGPPAPPLPPRVPSDDQTPRSTAATWVAATGALLLLVAAGIFLAVSWDVLGLTARVAVVASITAAAIVGGHRLRQILPAVGAVLFHLGALLLPVDALGLALQLDLSTASAWILTGAVTLLALPPLAIAGKSRVLATAAVVGAPVLATGLGLAGIIDPSLAVALFAVASLASLRLRGTRVARIWRGAPVALAMTAVLLPLIAAALDATLAEGQIVAAIQAAGWGPSSWVVPVIVGVLAVAADAIAAKALHSRPLAAIAPILAAGLGGGRRHPRGHPAAGAVARRPGLLPPGRGARHAHPGRRRRRGPDAVDRLDGGGRGCLRCPRRGTAGGRPLDPHRHRSRPGARRRHGRHGRRLRRSRGPSPPARRPSWCTPHPAGRRRDPSRHRCRNRGHRRRPDGAGCLAPAGRGRYSA
jgi:hypothetical protein